MHKVGKTSSPALRDNDQWVAGPEGKSNVFADAFENKWVLPEDDHDFRVLRTRTVGKILEALREDSGAGPGRLPARVLRRCAAEELVVP
eukprot:5444918-Alexandrium_andersonii.AAC.1